MKIFLRKLVWIGQRRRKEAELREELDCHLAEEADEQKAVGLTEQDARIAPRRELGSVALISEDTRSTWGWIWMERVGQDVRYALRIMRRQPGFALATVLTLMLGIGGNTAMFSLMNALLMRTLPFDRPEQLVRLTEAVRRDGAPGVDDFTLVTQDMLQRQTRAHCRRKS